MSLKEDLRALPELTKARILEDKILRSPLGIRAAYDYLNILAELDGRTEPKTVMGIVGYKLRTDGLL